MEIEGREEAAHIWRTTSVPAAAFLLSTSPLSWFFLSRASRWPIILFTWGAVSLTVSVTIDKLEVKSFLPGRICG